jgi:uncharacterized membrane protein YeaQ/YmgE (transglycosylase-associated protein family)
VGFIGWVIGAVITGAIVGALGRLILPGGQDIGIGKTIGLGVVSSFIVGLVLSGVNGVLAIIIAALVAAGLLWLGIRQGFLKPAS